MNEKKDNDPTFVGRSAELDILAKEASILDASENANTNRALENAVKHFTKAYGGRLPCTDEDLKDYLVMYAGNLSVATLEQRRVLIGRWHRENGFNHNPNDSEIVRKIMRGIRRKYGRKPKQAKPAPLRVIEKVVNYLDEVQESIDDHRNSKKLRCIRDKAMLLTAFWFGLRSDELINIRVCDVKFHWDGDTPYFELFLPKSKTDREGQGSTKKLDTLPNLCPMHALRGWIEASCEGVDSKSYRDSDFPLFAKVSRWGGISDSHIHPNAINKLFKSLLEEAGIDAEEYSTHSMRRGVANWIIDSGASVAELKDWIGWKDTRTAMRYLDGKSSLPSKIIEKKLKASLLPNTDQAPMQDRAIVAFSAPIAIDAGNTNKTISQIEKNTTPVQRISSIINDHLKELTPLSEINEFQRVVENIHHDFLQQSLITASVDPDGIAESQRLKIPRVAYYWYGGIVAKLCGQIFGTYSVYLWHEILATESEVIFIGMPHNVVASFHLCSRLCQMLKRTKIEYKKSEGKFGSANDREESANHYMYNFAQGVAGADAYLEVIEEDFYHFYDYADERYAYAHRQ